MATRVADIQKKSQEIATPRKILILYSQMGGGHVSAARRVKGLLENQNYHVDTIDLYDNIHQAPFKKIYNFFIGKGVSGFHWTLTIKGLRIFASATKIYKKWIKTLLKKRLLTWDQMYDGVIVNLPGAPLLLEAAQSVCLQLKIFVHILDFDDIPLSNYELSWSPKKDRWLSEQVTLISPSQLCTKTLLSQGIPLKRIASIHGFPMNLSDIFKKKLELQKRTKFQKKNLGPIKILVIFGANGSPLQLNMISHIARMERKIATLSRPAPAQPLHFTFVFGHSKKILKSAQKKVARLHLENQVTLHGWVDDMLTMIYDHDVVIGKPGATSVCESLTVGRPYFTVRNINTYPQEKASGRFILSTELGIVRKTYRGLVRVCYRLDPKSWQHLCQRALELSSKFAQADQEFSTIIAENLQKTVKY